MSDSVHLYGPAFSTFVRVAAIVCEEKGIAYSVGKTIAGQDIAVHSRAHYDLHPFGKMPVLIHGERLLTETACIGRYLDRTFGPETLQGTSEWDKAQVDQWCSFISHYVDFYLMRQYMLELAFPKGEDGRPRMDVIAANRPAAEKALAAVETRLEEKPYLLGDTFTLADAMMAPMLSYNLETPKFLNIVTTSRRLHDYTLRLRERDSGRRVLKPLSESL